MVGDWCFGTIDIGMAEARFALIDLVDYDSSLFRWLFALNFSVGRCFKIQKMVGWERFLHLAIRCDEGGMKGYAESWILGSIDENKLPIYLEC